MIRLNRILVIPVPSGMSSSIATRGERVLHTSCGSRLVKNSRWHIDSVPGDSRRESFDMIPLDIIKRLDPGKSLDNGLFMCGKNSPKNPENSSNIEESKDADIKITNKTYPEIIEEYSREIAEKVSAMNEKKASGMFGDPKSPEDSRSGPNSPDESTKKFVEEENEISVIIEPVTSNFPSRNDLGMMMITVREKIASSVPFESVDLRINGLNPHQTNPKLSNLRVTSSSDRIEIKIPIKSKRKSKLNFVLSDSLLEELRRDSAASLNRVTGEKKSVMSRIVPWWTTLESFRALGSGSKEAKQMLKSESVSTAVNNESNHGKSVKVFSTAKAEPVPIEHDKAIKLVPLQNSVKLPVAARSKIPLPQRLNDGHLRYAPMLKNQKTEETIGMTPSGSKLSSPTSKIPVRTTKIAFEKLKDESSMSLPSKLVNVGKKVLENIEVKLASGVKPVERKKEGKLVDLGHYLPIVKVSEGKFGAEENRLKKELITERGRIEALKEIGKKSARDGSADILGVRVPEKRADLQSQGTKKPDVTEGFGRLGKCNESVKSAGFNHETGAIAEFLATRAKSANVKLKLKSDQSVKKDPFNLPKNSKVTGDNNAQLGTLKRQNPEEGSSSDGNSLVTLNGTKTPGKSGYSTYTREFDSKNEVEIKDANALSTPGTRSMRKFKMRLQRSVDRDTEKNADTGGNRWPMEPLNNGEIKENDVKKIFYSSWLNNRNEEVKVIDKPGSVEGKKDD